MAKPPSRSPLHLTRLRLVNWRNFQNADVTLQMRSFFIGPNASGKSNLLDAIRFLSELAQVGSGGLKAAVELRGGFSALRCLQARTTSYIEMEAHVGSIDNGSIWQYLVRFSYDKKAKCNIVLKEKVVRDGELLRGREKRGSDSSFEFSQTLIEQISFSKDFRDLSSFLSSCRYLHVVPQIVRDRSRGRTKGEDPYGGDLLRRMKDMPRKTRDPRMRRISEALQVAVPQFGSIELVDDSDGVPHLAASYNHWRLHASKQLETAFSDGTLRLIGLLWSMTERGGPLLLEEPELSLNDAVVTELPKMFAQMQKLSKRQLIATTHSSALLDDTGLGLKEVHCIFVGTEGSTIQTLSNNPAVSIEVSSGMTLSEAALPLLRPRNVERLGILKIA